MLAEILSGDLPPTKTYAVRRWVYVVNPDPTALSDGTLTITLRKSLRPGAKSEDDTYDVAEQREAVRGFRRFILVNRATGEAHEVTLSDRGDLCTCEAGRYRVASGCKHRDCLRALVREGAFDRPFPAPYPRLLSAKTV